MGWKIAGFGYCLQGGGVMVENDEHQFESDIEAVMTGELEPYKESLIFECVTGKREVA